MSEIVQSKITVSDSQESGFQSFGKMFASLHRIFFISMGSVDFAFC